MEEKTLSSSYIYRGKILTLRKDLVRTGAGVEATREIIEHHQAVVVIPVLENKKMVLIKQYRKAVEEILFEIPAGLLNEEEIPIEAAKRELKEETGYVADKLIPLINVYASPGFTDEYMHFFLA
ncbi:MAG: NUDIX hydrolase, partial [Candidatus Margulisiibacteriota bacterium]